MINFKTITNFMENLKNKVKNFLSKYADKFKMEKIDFVHFACSFIIAFLVGIFSSVEWAVVITAMICIAKEFCDMIKKDPNGFSRNNLEYDLYGLFIAILLISLFTI